MDYDKQVQKECEIASSVGSAEMKLKIIRLLKKVEYFEVEKKDLIHKIENL